MKVSSIVPSTVAYFTVTWHPSAYRGGLRKSCLGVICRVQATARHSAAHKRDRCDTKTSCGVAVPSSRDQETLPPTLLLDRSSMTDVSICCSKTSFVILQFCKVHDLTWTGPVDTDAVWEFSTLTTSVLAASVSDTDCDAARKSESRGNHVFTSARGRDEHSNKSTSVTVHSERGHLIWKI